VTLGGATLNLILGYPPNLGDSYMLISNDGADAVIGQFTQGITITVGSHTYQINYGGGDGNDVVLTKCGGGIVNQNTSVTYCTIQDAINNATVNDVITVAAGTYVENVIVNKPLTLKGAKFGIDCNGRLGPESIISGPGASGTMAVRIDADNVTMQADRMAFTVKEEAT
jgi:hypothetical protein